MVEMSKPYLFLSNQKQLSNTGFHILFFKLYAFMIIGFMCPNFIESLLKQAYVAKLIQFPPQKRKVTFLVFSYLRDLHSSYLISFLKGIAYSDFFNFNIIF